MKIPIIELLLHDIRSAHNVGSILRSADGLGVGRVYCSGFTPYPYLANDQRLPHVIKNTTAKISKTALGAEKSIDISITLDVIKLCTSLKTEGYQIVALEQAVSSISISKFSPAAKTLLMAGNEVDGLPKSLLDIADQIVEIPMLGKKESLNVSVAVGIALYSLRN